MPMLVAGVLLLWLSSTLLRGFVRANPASLARLFRRGGGWLALVFALVMMFRGEFNLAFGAACFGLWLISSAQPSPVFGRVFQGGTPFRQPRRGGTSRVASPTVEMSIDRRSGTIEGRCLSGPFRGRPLDSLSDADCAALHQWCLREDGQGARLLETYFDRRFPRWREAAHGGDDPGGAEPGFQRRGPTRMPEREAYQVLGLQEGASREEVTRAHRQLMKRVHPDHGGTTEMAARVNEAKDVLMRRHP